MLGARTVLLLVTLLSLSPCCDAAPYAPSECCFGYVSSPLRLLSLKASYPTPRECFLPAIVFETRNGSKVCANPEEAWAKKRVEQLLKRQRTSSPTK